MEKHTPWQPMAIIQHANCGTTMSQPMAFHKASTAMQSYSIINYAFFLLVQIFLLSRIEPGPWFIKEKLNDCL